jgi:hypothetical protein
MGHYEGFNAREDKGVEKFIERFKKIWTSEGIRTKGKTEERYGLTIGTNSRIALFEPLVTTSKGVKTLIAWNLSTEDINQIKKAANEVGIAVIEVPYLWLEVPTNLPGQTPPE